VISEVYDRPFSFELNTAADCVLNADTLDIFRRQLAEMGLLLHSRPDGYQFAVKSGLYAFIAAMFRTLRYRFVSETTLPQTEEYLQDFDLVKQYIKQHFKEEIDQAQIGRALGMSRSKVYRVLRSASSSSTKDMTNYYRVEYAKHLLKSTEQPVQYIVAESGFASDASFYRVFREVAGTSPQEYRKTPEKRTESAGIQGYAQYSVPESIELLREYARESEVLKTLS
jgi:AraC-like DNA-binding protein